MDRINTSKFLSNDDYFSAVDYSSSLSDQAMSVSPLVSDQYDYALTEDIVLLNERKDTAEQLYNIWVKSPYVHIYSPDKDHTQMNKIPKDKISEIFYYMKKELQKVKTINAYEMVLAINEFFDFNYNYVVDKVLSPKIKAEILEDYYNNGMKERMEDTISEKLF